MAEGKIFIRERRKVDEQQKVPRFAVVAIAGLDLKIRPMHMKKKEIEEIANQVGAELILLDVGGKGEGGRQVDDE